MTAKTPEELDSLISSNSNIPIFDYRVIILQIFAGLIGFYYFKYGRKTDNNFFIFSGLTLFITSFFLTDLLYLSLISIILFLIPFVFKNNN